MERASPYHAPYPPGQEEDEGYYEDPGELLFPEEYEDMLFQRVLDKIRVARAIGNADVQLTSEELDAYKSKLHGARPATARPVPLSRPPDSPLNDTASVTSVQAKHAPVSSRTKKEKQRTSLFGSKSKKEKDKDKSSQRKRISTSSSIASHPPDQISPGFVVPDPDSQAVFAPINSYSAKFAHDQPSPHLISRSTSGSHQTSSSPQATPPQDVLGAFPGSEHFYRPAILQDQSQSQSQLHHQIPSLSVRQQAYARERQLEAQGIASAAQAQAARSIPFPVEMYQYQTFSTASGSASPTSPQILQMPQQYARRVSSGQSESSYTSMPRRVPVPTPAAPVPLERSVTTSSGYSPPALGQEYGLGVEVAGLEQGQGGGHSTSGGKDGGRKRKSGKGMRKKKKDAG